MSVGESLTILANTDTLSTAPSTMDLDEGTEGSGFPHCDILPEPLNFLPMPIPPNICIVDPKMLLPELAQLTESGLHPEIPVPPQPWHCHFRSHTDDSCQNQEAG